MRESKSCCLELFMDFWGKGKLKLDFCIFSIGDFREVPQVVAVAIAVATVIMYKKTTKKIALHVRDFSRKYIFIYIFMISLGIPLEM